MAKAGTYRGAECWPRCVQIAWRRQNIDNEHVLDPIKVTILTPGMKKDGTMDEFRYIPASLVAKYLDERHRRAKPVPYNLLFCSALVSTKPNSEPAARAH